MTTLRRAIQFQIVLLMIAGMAMAQSDSLQPLSEEEVTALVTSVRLGGIPSEKAAEIINQRGVSFAINAIFLTELEVKGADSAIMQALRRLKEKGRDKTPFAVSPAQPVEEISTLPPATLPDGTLLDEKNWPKFLEAVRAKAMVYTEDLPNFICAQITQRSIRFFPEGWRLIDNFVADLSYYDKKEHYKIISVANKPSNNVTMENLKGARSTGEFGSTMSAIFDPKSRAVFRLEGPEQSNGRDTIRISFNVPLETSNRGITYEDESLPKRTIITAYRGRVWIDPTSFQIVRIEDKALNIPLDFPITRSEGAIDYDLADISGKKYWLPVHAEMYMVEGGRKLHTKNIIEFKKYRKFEAEVKLVSDSEDNSH
jgi:hypothetical protein